MESPIIPNRLANLREAIQKCLSDYVLFVQRYRAHIVLTGLNRFYENENGYFNVRVTLSEVDFLLQYPSMRLQIVAKLMWLIMDLSENFNSNDAFEYFFVYAPENRVSTLDDLSSSFCRFDKTLECELNFDHRHLTALRKHMMNGMRDDISAMYQSFTAKRKRLN